MRPEDHTLNTIVSETDVSTVLEVLWRCTDEVNDVAGIALQYGHPKPQEIQAMREAIGMANVALARLDTLCR